MARFLLLHGSWHGAWCWHKVLPRLRAAGHSAEAIDLPGRGRRPGWGPAIGLSTMVQAALRYLPANEKTTVVAHSRNGIVASTLAEVAPERIDRTIYVASFMLPSGRRVLDYLPDRASHLHDQVEVRRWSMSDWLRPEAYRDALYADCSEDDVDLARALLTPEPSRPALTRLKLGDRYHSVPRAYLRLTEDRAVSLALQDRLLAETTVQRVESLTASHSAYFSRPDELTKALLRLAGS